MTWGNWITLELGLLFWNTLILIGVWKDKDDEV